eukprot:TRINITY_DN12768_c0_g1_i6.p1 TRINITY_DN12768_c0_g1~~TRINITY_DN12768_c0_g1_i6.p1  ORF type:complete len:245 (+),score=42.76 TRINITY_DN12768_c0_g1_i6:715-1449(+)
MISIWKFECGALEKTSPVVTIPFHSRVTKLLLSANCCLAATDNGKLSLIPLEEIVKGSKEIDRLNVSLFISRIIELSWLVPDKYFVGIGDENYLKIFDYEKREIVNGGLLSKRLEGSILTCMQVYQSKVYLGTNKSAVLIYTVMEPDYKPKHVLTIALEAVKSPLISLKVRGSDLFVASEKLITKLTIPSEGDPKFETVYKLSKSQKSAAKLPLIKTLEHIEGKDSHIMIAGCTVLRVFNYRMD